MGGIRDFEEPPADYFLVGFDRFCNFVHDFLSDNSGTALSEHC